jgi:hypothetical protein
MFGVYGSWLPRGVNRGRKAGHKRRISPRQPWRICHGVREGIAVISGRSSSLKSQDSRRRRIVAGREIDVVAVVMAV